MKLSLFFSPASELCSLHHWRWKRDFNCHLKIPGQGLCRYVSLTSGISVNIWCSPLIVCVQVWVNVSTSSHYSMSVPRIPASGTNSTERKVNCQSKSKKKSSDQQTCIITTDKAECCAEVTAVARAMTKNWSLTLWEFSPSCILTFFRNNANTNTTSTHEFCPPIIRNRWSPPFNLEMECLSSPVACLKTQLLKILYFTQNRIFL